MALMPGLPAAQVCKLITWAEQTPAVLELYVFGSRAKGMHRPDSDVDVAVTIATVPGLTNKNSYDQHWLDWVADLGDRLELDVELLRLADDETPKPLQV